VKVGQGRTQARRFPHIVPGFGGATLKAMVSASIASTRESKTTERSTRPVAIWLLVCCAMIFAMVVIGGITRLTWSGLSITEWQPVKRIVPPLSAADWKAEFAKYRRPRNTSC